MALVPLEQIKLGQVPLDTKKIIGQVPLDSKKGWAQTRMNPKKKKPEKDNVTNAPRNF